MICNLCSFNNPPDVINCKRCGKKIMDKKMQSTTILVVEDSSIVRLMIQTILSVEGYKVLEAADGVSGVNKALEELPDLILMDILLPSMNGIDAINILKQNPRTKNIPIMAISCLDTKKHVMSAIEAGCNDYLKKPFIPENLLKKIHNLLPQSKIKKGS